MPENLHDHATADRDAMDVVTDAVAAALARARNPVPLDAMGVAVAEPEVAGLVASVVAAITAAAAGDVPDLGPPFVAADDWEDVTSPLRHLDVARGTIAGVRAEITLVRAALATVPNPAAVAGLEDRLRLLLVDEAALAVERRRAEERVAATKTRVDALGVLTAAIEPVVRAADDHVEWAEEHQAEVDAMRGALSVTPLDSIVVDAQALLAGAASDADDRLDELLPPTLRSRAAERLAEADAVGSEARALLTTAQTELHDLDLLRSPMAVDLTTALDRFAAASTALADYVTGAATRLEVAESLLVSVDGLADLSEAQTDALAEAANADGVTAAAAESALAVALTDLRAAEDAVDDAILAARVTDPDLDPETVQTVIDARDALAEAAIQDPVTAARAGYDDASRSDLDTWEVEVPERLWQALQDYESARALLDGLADQAARDALVAELDAAQDDVVAAVDELGVHRRRRWWTALAEADRRAQVRAAERTAEDRRRHYLRGHGPGGRTTLER